MAQPKPSAAQALYGHLRSGERPEQQQRTPNVADAMWPKLSREAKAQEADQRLWAQILKRQRHDFVQRRREANAMGKR
jgi:hypothetical protein